MPATSDEGTGGLRPEWVVAAMLVIVPIATGNLTGFGIGSSPFLYDTVALPRLAAMLVLGTAAWALWWWKSAEGTPLAVNTVWGVLAALGGWAVVSAIASQQRWFTVLGQSERLEGVVTIVFYAVLYGLALQTLRSKRALRLVAACFAGASTLLAAYGLVQFAGLDRGNYDIEKYGFTLRVAFATLGNPNFLGALLVLALPCAAALALSSHGIPRAAWGVSWVVLVLGLVATLTRGAWIAAGVEIGVASIVFAAWVRSTKPALGRRTVWIAVVLGVVLVAAMGAILLRPDLRQGKLYSSSGLESRFALQRVAVAAATARPVLGYGPDSFIAAYRAQRGTALGVLDGPATQNNAHSWPFQYAATLGAPGALLLVLAIALALWWGRSALSPAQARSDPLMAAVWIACLGFGVAMAVNVAMLASTVPFWVLLGALGARRAREVDVPRKAAVGAAAIGTLVAVLMLVASASLVAADARFLESRFYFNGVRPGDAVAEAGAASRLNPLSVKYARGEGQAAAQRVSSAIAAGESKKNVYLESAAASAAFDRALAISPADYATLAWLAALQGETGAYVRDARLLAASRETAQKARLLDQGRSEVTALAAGDTSPQAIRGARAVLPLP
jgi:O-antigen ligase